MNENVYKDFLNGYNGGPLGFLPENYRQGEKASFFRDETGYRVDDAGKKIEGSEVGGGLNFGNLGAVAGGVSSFAQIINSIRQSNLAKKQLAFNKQSYEENLRRQTKEYNRNIADIADTRKAHRVDGAESYYTRNAL